MTRVRRRPFVAAAGAVTALALLPTEAMAVASMIANLGDIDSKQRLWLAAFGGLSLGIAFGLFAFELRSRALAVAVRRLMDLVVGMDGRVADHSDRRSAAVELGRLSDELMFVAQRAARDRRETEQKMGSWESLFAAALEGLFALDASGRITYINPAAERLFKVKADECVGKLLSDVMLPPAHRSPDNAAFASDLASGKAQGRTQELVAQRGDGRQFPVEVSIAEYGADERRGFVVVARDISQVRRSRAELKRVRSQAASMEAELRAEIEALRRGRSAHSAKPVQSPIAEPAPASPALTEERPVARPRSAALRREVFTLEALCGDAIRKLAARAERRGLGFRYEDSELQATPLVGDAKRLQRVLIGIVDTVVKASERGEIVVHLQSAAGDGPALAIVAQITATGMTDAQAARMLKPFVTETLVRQETARYPGRANMTPHIDFLGTTITHNVMPGAGATFRFEMPFEADLTHVAIDLSALPCTAPAAPAPAPGASVLPARLSQEFVKSAARLRKHAEKPTLIALWAESHRLKDLWQRNGGGDDIGLVTALAHAARGGDATNAVLIARRLADALEEAARVSNPNALRA